MAKQRLFFLSLTWHIPSTDSAESRPSGSWKIRQSPKRDRRSVENRRFRHHCLDHATRDHTGETGSLEHQCIARPTYGLTSASPLLPQFLACLACYSSPTLESNSSADSGPGLREQAEDRLAPDPAILAQSDKSRWFGGRASMFIKALCSELISAARPVGSRGVPRRLGACGGN